jgi:hypothetical protein
VKHRLYIDEVGNPDLGASSNPNHRYLSLTGVAIELGYVDSVVAPELEALKRRYFETHVDEPLVFHRKELVNRKFTFHQLRDPNVEARFNTDLIQLLNTLDYTVITVIIDKLEHVQRYNVWKHDPYHYCQQVLLERYILWLRQHNFQGDVMAESRGKKEDSRLMKSFEHIYDHGTDFIDTAEFKVRLTSRQLKVKPKSNNIAGLQLADLIAHPSFKATLARQQNQALGTTFGAKIADILEKSKYYRSPSGRIDGWGRKWLP